MKVKNSMIEDLINRLSYLYILLFKKKTTVTPLRDEVNPIWISGLFRSGTTITTQLIEKLGADLGPSNHLLKAKGQRAALNPNGFYENYLFMDWSLVALNKLNSWGDQPPKIEAVKEFDHNRIDYKGFVYDSLVNIHDDRISNWNKAQILKHYSPENLPNYINECFQKTCAIKNPHFILLSPILDQLFPKGHYLVVFRNPSDAIQSAKKVSPKVTFDLYHHYYTNIIKHPKALFFNYDQLIASPLESIQQLATHLNLKGDMDQMVSLIKKTNATKTSELIPANVQKLHEQLIQKAIN